MTYLKIWSGLCNRLAPLISTFRICKEKGLKLFVFWSSRVGRWPFTFHGSEDMGFLDLFKPIEGVQFVSTIPSSVNPINIDYQGNYRDLKDNTFLDSTWNLIGDPTLDDEKEVRAYTHWPPKFGMVGESRYSESLRKYFKLLKPVEKIQEKIDNIVSQFGSHTVGVHIRRSDRLPNTIPIDPGNRAVIVTTADERICKRLDSILKEDPNVKFFIATDHTPTDFFYRSRYGDSIVDAIDFFGGLMRRGENSNLGTMNGVIDMFGLSRCNYIMGSTHSSFSTIAWLLAEKGIPLEILTGVEYPGENPL